MDKDGAHSDIVSNFLRPLWRKERVCRQAEVLMVTKLPQTEFDAYWQSGNVDEASLMAHNFSRIFSCLVRRNGHQLVWMLPHQPHGLYALGFLRWMSTMPPSNGINLESSWLIRSDQASRDCIAQAHWGSPDIAGWVSETHVSTDIFWKHIARSGMRRAFWGTGNVLFLLNAS